MEQQAHAQTSSFLQDNPFSSLHEYPTLGVTPKIVLKVPANFRKEGKLQNGSKQTTRGIYILYI